MASIAALNSQSRLTEVVDLAISDDEGDKDSKTRATAHNSLLNGKNATVSTQNSSSDKVPKNSGIPSHFPKFSKVSNYYYQVMQAWKQLIISV